MVCLIESWSYITFWNSSNDQKYKEEYYFPYKFGTDLFSTYHVGGSEYSKVQRCSQSRVTENISQNNIAGGAVYFTSSIPELSKHLLYFCIHNNQLACNIRTYEEVSWLASPPPPIANHNHNHQHQYLVLSQYTHLLCYPCGVWSVVWKDQWTPTKLINLLF